MKYVYITILLIVFFLILIKAITKIVLQDYAMSFLINVFEI